MQKEEENAEEVSRPSQADIVETLGAWLVEKGHAPDRPCPVCNVSAWAIGEIAQLRLYPGSEVALRGGEVYPVVPLVCGNCGYTMFFNAIRVGVLPKNEDSVARGGEES